MERIKLISDLSLGDHVVMLAAIESLHLQYPKQYITGVKIPQMELYKGHPAISPGPNGKDIKLHYPDVHKSNQVANSFLDGYCHYLGKELGVELQPQVNHSHLYLDEKEKKKFSGEKYWIVVSSHKMDFTTKCLSQKYLQEVVDHFIGKVKFVQPVKENDKNTINYPLNNVRIISKLNVRDMMSLVYNCEGVICQVTSWHHLAGSFEKPCICIGGNREPSSWVMQYPNQHYLHSAGCKLKCCLQKSCWKSRVIKLNNGSQQDMSLCENPCFYDNQWLASCILQIRPSTIIDTLERLI